ncbi:hypothetical protein [Paenibacillus antri]|uniref:hypothetical protein n=1 Tax=Paenibacillus antri TaxID=2582848 RepID=UPI00192E597F|nr:hypothetical protein [Paenibacillus antri]
MNEPIHPETTLPQWHALLLESLKRYGWSNEELLRKIQEGDLPKDESKFQFDYADLIAYAREHADTLEQAVRRGYRVKYNTLRGIHSWIAVALRRDAELVLEPGAEAVVVPLSAEETRRVVSMLSTGWKLSVADPTPDADGRVLTGIEPMHRI